MLSDLLYRLRALLLSKRMEQELDDELSFHLEHQAAKYTRAGAAPAEARRLAHVALEGPEQIKEACRDARGTVWLWAVAQDARYGWRQLVRSPGFTAAAVLVLALGIGANTAIFSLLDAVMLTAVPVRDPHSLVVPKWSANSAPHPYGISSFESCFEGKIKKAEGRCSFSYPVLRRMQASNNVFSDLTGFAGPIQINAKATGAAELVQGDIVDGSFFRTLGVKPLLGRMLTPDDDSASAPATVVLAFGYWRRAFGGDSSVIGKTIRLNGYPFTAIGVAAPEFSRLSPGTVCDLWFPIEQSPKLGLVWIPKPLADEHEWWLKLIGRLKPGVSAAQAQEALTEFFRNDVIYGSKLLKPDSDPVIEVAPANQALTGIRRQLAKPLSILMCSVGIMLLMACANIAGLITARSAARQRELAIRLAIGAGRGRIVRQLLTESILLAILGGVAGLLFAWWGTRMLTAFLDAPLNVAPDSRILLFTIGISMLSGLFFGTLPALRGTRIDPGLAMTRSAGLQHGMSAMRRHSRVGTLLVIAQVALAIVLLQGAGLLVRTIVNLKDTKSGFDARNILLFGLDPLSSRYTEAQTRNLYRNLRDRLIALPGVVNVTYSSEALLAGGWNSQDFVIHTGTNTLKADVLRMAVGPDYFRTMRVPLLAGTTFEPADFLSKRPVALVNAAFSQKFLKGKTALGIRFGDASPNAEQYEVIGVVGNTKYGGIREPMDPITYLPLTKGNAYFELRTAENPSALIPEVRKIVQEMDSNLPLFGVHTQTERIDETLMIERVLARLSTLFGSLALMLTCVGLYGLLAYDVSQRTREIGIRIAMGALPRTVQGTILRGTLTLAATGVALGVPCALLGSRALTSILYGVKPGDPATLAGAGALLLLVSVAAAYIPSRRASRIDPMVALRHE